MQLHAAVVGFGDDELQRVPIRHRGFAAVGQITAPRLDAAVVEDAPRKTA